MPVVFFFFKEYQMGVAFFKGSVNACFCVFCVHMSSVYIKKGMSGHGCTHVRESERAYARLSETHAKGKQIYTYYQGNSQMLEHIP